MKLNEKISKGLIAAGSLISGFNDYRRLGRYSWTPYEHKFGSWIIALNAAGLDSPYLTIPTDDELFDNLKKVWRKMGRQPGYRHLKPPISKYWAKIYLKSFGTWNKTLEIFKLYCEDKEKYRKALIKLPYRNKPKRAMSIRLRYEVFKRDRYRCKVCGRSPATHLNVFLTVDHIKPLQREGKTILTNLQTLCSECNGGKGDL